MHVVYLRRERRKNIKLPGIAWQNSFARLIKYASRLQGYVHLTFTIPYVCFCKKKIYCQNWQRNLFYNYEYLLEETTELIVQTDFVNGLLEIFEIYNITRLTFPYAVSTGNLTIMSSHCWFYRSSKANNYKSNVVSYEQNVCV